VFIGQKTGYTLTDHQRLTNQGTERPLMSGIFGGGKMLSHVLPKYYLDFGYDKSVIRVMYSIILINIFFRNNSCYVTKANYVCDHQQ